MKIIRFSLISGLLLGFSQAGIITLAHPDEKLPSESTVIWSPLFQATWDMMNQYLGGPAERIDPPNPLMKKLDATQWDSKAVMPEKAWKTWAGIATKPFLEQVNREAIALTGEQMNPFALPAESTSQSLACYGILDRKLEFARPFYRSKAPLLFKVGEKNIPVRFFGTPGSRIGEFENSVRILSWKPTECSHAIQVTSKQAGESLLLYLPPKPLDFATVCIWLHKWRTQPLPPDASTLHGTANDPFPHNRDLIKIPYVSLDVRNSFLDRLKGNRFHPGSAGSMQIIAADQHTRFKLHEKGAEVRVETTLVSYPFASEPPPPAVIPRHFIYDRPFFVFLWRDHAEWPYFGAWIGEESALEKMP